MCVGGAPGAVVGQMVLGRRCCSSLVHIETDRLSEFVGGWETLVSLRHSLSLAAQA